MKACYGQINKNKFTCQLAKLEAHERAVHMLIMRREEDTRCKKLLDVKTTLKSKKRIRSPEEHYYIAHDEQY